MHIQAGQCGNQCAPSHPQSQKASVLPLHQGKLSLAVKRRELLVLQRCCERKVLTAGSDGGAGLARSSGVRPACLFCALSCSCGSFEGICKTPITAERAPAVCAQKPCAMSTAYPRAAPMRCAHMQLAGSQAFQDVNCCKGSASRRLTCFAAAGRQRPAARADERVLQRGQRRCAAHMLDASSLTHLSHQTSSAIAASFV